MIFSHTTSLHNVKLVVNGLIPKLARYIVRSMLLQITADALMHVYPIYHKLPLLHSCFAGKPVKLHQENQQYGLRCMVARILPSAYGRMPPLVVWGIA